MKDEKESKARTADPAALAVLESGDERSGDTAYDRHLSQGKRCPFGEKGTCCRICEMGPCRITEKNPKGICGADAATVVARHLIRRVAGGAAAHSDHGHDIARALLHTAEGKTQGYSIKNEERLLELAAEWGVETKDKPIEEIAKEVARLSLEQFNQQEGEIRYPALRAPAASVANWRENGILPVGVEHPIVETLHRTHEGVDADYRNLLMHGLRTSMADGWGGAMLATDLGDVLFGAPNPLRSKVNLGVLKEDEVNIVVHGHEPTLSDMIVTVSRDPELKALAKEKGAKGIVVGGICCTANEILMRQGAPVVGNFLHQELAIATGAVDLMLVDVQCIMPAVVEHARRFHTKVITTNKKARIPGAEHVAFDETRAYDIAKDIVRRAVENFPNRGHVDIPQYKEDLVAGFTAQNTFRFLGGRYRATYRPLNDAIINEGGLGERLSDLPVAGAAPEAMCEKAIAIGFYCVASGLYVNFSPAMRVSGSPDVTRFLTEDMEGITGGKFSFEDDPVNAARLMMQHMDKKRVPLKLKPVMYGTSFLNLAAA